MKMLELPYGKRHLSFACEGAKVLRPRMFAPQGELSGSEIVRRAMEEPIDSPGLSVLAAGKRRATIIISDHTRPVPSRDILPHMLAQLRAGSPEIAVTLLVATGFHRGTTREELAVKLGEEIACSERILVHDCQDAAQNVAIGTLPSGAPLVVNRAAVDTDLLLSEGFIEPHFFAGFSGGRKSILPGICARETVLGNHCGAFIDSPFARTGVLESNPLHRDMAAAARTAKLAYIVNVIIDGRKDVVAAFAGEPEAAHAKGCAFLAGCCRVKPQPADIVITTNGGWPLDQNIYQSVKGLTAAEASANPGAVLIMCAECADGAGGADFYRLMADCDDVDSLYRRLARTPQECTRPDQWEAQVLARILRNHRVIFVTEPELRETVTRMKMTYSPSLKEAFAMARREKGDAAPVTVIPDGVSVIVGHGR